MNLEKMSATQLGGLVRRKEVSPTEVIKYFRNRIEERNPSINAFTYLNFEDALTEAEELEERLMQGEELPFFAGVPIALKDFLPEKKGWPATHGGVRSLQTIDHVNGVVYRAAARLGCIAIGKTNAPSFGFRGTTDNKMYGPTSTPFKVGYNSGGSSGGSAAAVADGLVPIASAGDAGGSIRIPAAWCGCFGFKASAGLVPSVCRPDAWTATHPYCCPGPITRTVQDSAYIIQEMIKYNMKDPLSVPLGKKDLSPALGERVRGLKVGYTYDFDLFPYPEDEIVSKITNVINLMHSNRIEVEPVKFEFHHSRSEIEESWLRSISIDSAIDFELWKKNGTYDLSEHLSDYPDEFLEWNDKAIASTMMDYRQFHEIRTDVLDAHNNVFLNGFDIIIAPVTGCLPVKNSNFCNTKGPSEINGEPVDQLIGFAYTYLENMTGTPAASVPIGVTESGLPIGLQIIGQRYRDEDVFAIAYFLEEALGWDYEIPYNRPIS